MTRRRFRETPEEREMRLAREESERRDARMNETMTRGAILEAIDLALYSEHSSGVVEALRALRSAFE